MKPYVAEFIGTFFLVTTVGLVVASGDPLGGVAIGAVLAALVVAGSRSSGAHYNPAVSLAFLVRGKTDMAGAVKVMLVQLLAAILAGFACLHLLDGQAVVIAPGGETVPALLAEFLFSFALAWVYLNASDEPGSLGLAVGLVVLAGTYAVGSISGAAFNPAVGIGPAVVATIFGDGSFGDVWLYLVGPLAGAAVAALASRVTDG